MNPIRALRTLFGDVRRTVQLLAEIRSGIANLADDTNRRLERITADIEQIAAVQRERADRGDRPRENDRDLQANEHLVEIRDSVMELAFVMNRGLADLRRDIPAASPPASPARSAGNEMVTIREPVLRRHPMDERE